MEALRHQPVRAAVGDDSPSKIWLQVGLFMTVWEFAEFKLSRLHSLFLGRPDSWDAIQEYGKGTVHSARIQCLCRQSEIYFQGNPNQNDEGEFNSIINETTSLSIARNDIVHGAVFDCSILEHYRTILDSKEKAPQWLLIPPIQTIKRHSGDAPGLPTYSYNADLLHQSKMAVIQLASKIDSFGQRMFATFPGPPTW